VFAVGSNEFLQRKCKRLLSTTELDWQFFLFA